MKRQFVILLFFLPIIMMAQDAIVYNHPKYYQDGDYWVQALVPFNFWECIRDYETEGSGENFSLYCFYVEGDTIIDNKEYKCVHAKIWDYDCEATYDHQPEGLIEGPRVANVLFMREDADGKQWRRLAYLNDEALLFDFSHPFEEGKKIRFCMHDNLCDVVDNVIYYKESQTRAYSSPSRRKVINSSPSDDEAPKGYFYDDWTVSKVSTIELPNGEQVPIADGRIVFGWGDVYVGDLLHQICPICESYEGMFLYRVHQGQVIFRNNGNTQSINNIIGTDVLSLFDKPEAYRPFIEEGKVWKVGGAESGNPVNRVEYYYFDGDTIVNGKTCKQMMRQRFVSPNHPNYAIFSQWPSLSYVGAWYEEDKKVYFCKEKSKEFNMMYDFSLDANETFQVDNGYVSYVIGPRETGGIKGFKGIYRDIMWASEQSPYPYNTTWLEGVGNIDGPMYSVYLGKEGHALFLMSCTVGDEVIYFNDEYEDGATPVVMEAPKVRFDFTHTVKTQPRVPKKKVAEKSLYGEYNTQQLDINLNPLNETYQVRITDETGKVVYEKSINAGNIVGLNIDISAFTEGCYTVSVENSHESFTGEFNSNTTGIEEIRSRNSELSGHYIYDLQGRKINAQSSILNAQLPKGIYIQNGKKVVVR